MKIPFVNAGKEFELPILNVDMHQEWLEEMGKAEKKIKDEKILDLEGSKLLILMILKQVDDNVKIEDINKMHPFDFAKLSRLIWDTGRIFTDGEKQDFQIS